LKINTHPKESKNQKRGLEKILQNEIKQKHKNLLKNDVHNLHSQKKNGIRVYRRYRDQDGDNEKLRIPKELLKYLPEAWEEFAALRKEYVSWLNNWQKELYANEELNEEDVVKKILALHTPSLEIRIPRDESERQGSLQFRDDNEW